MKIIKLRLSTLLLLLITGACQTNSLPVNATAPEKKADLTVSAAVSLREAFDEIGALHKSKTGQTVSFNFGSSGALQQQIETGAPVDVFASAGAKQMDELAKKDLIELASRYNFARNTLILIAPVDSKFKITAFDDLSKTEIQKIAVGNSQTVPAGQYTAELFEKMNLKKTVQAKLIFAEDVRQVLDYVVRGETDAGIVYTTDAHSVKKEIRVVAVASENAHAPILYPIAIVKDSQQKQSAQDFINLVLSDEGKAILQKFEFASATEK